MSQVRLAKIAKSFDQQPVLSDVNIEVADGEFLVFVGPSGCGKSTLMRTIAGLERPTGGHVFIADKDVTFLHPARRGVAMVFQSYALYPHMTVRENIAFGLRLTKKTKNEIRQAVDEAAEILQIRELLDRKPAVLSGGQRQRVAIGRAIVRQPEVFLFDEPLSNLDALLRVQMRLELIKLHQRLEATMIYVTHDQTEAMTMADRIVVLNQGRVEQIGTPLELYEHPHNRFVAGFIGSPKMNFVTVRCDAVYDHGVSVRLPDQTELEVPARAPGAEADGELLLGVRPEHLGIGQGIDGPPDALASAEVSVVEQLGSESIVHASLADGTDLQLKTAGHERVASGDGIKIALRGALCHLFDANGVALEPLADTAAEAVSA